MARKLPELEQFLLPNKEENVIIPDLFSFCFQEMKPYKCGEENKDIDLKAQCLQNETIQTRQYGLTAANLARCPLVIDSDGSQLLTSNVSTFLLQLKTFISQPCLVLGPTFGLDMGQQEAQL